MDRIGDSGSPDKGSIPFGSTKEALSQNRPGAFLGYFRQDTVFTVLSVRSFYYRVSRF